MSDLRLFYTQDTDVPTPSSGSASVFIDISGNWVSKLSDGSIINIGSVGPSGATGPIGPSGATGPIGPSGATGVVSGTYPILYASGTQSVSVDTGYWIASGTDTDGIPEGVTNLYFSNTLVDSHLSGTSPINYLSGVISTTLTQYTDLDSVAACSGIYEPILGYVPLDTAGGTMSGTLTMSSGTGIEASGLFIIDSADSMELHGHTSLSLTTAGDITLTAPSGIFTNDIFPEADSTHDIGSSGLKYDVLWVNAISGVSLEATTVSAPLQLSGNNVSIPSGSSITNGYISSGDWVTFNNKQVSGNYFISGTNTDYIPEGTGNLYFTDARVSGNPTVSGNTAQIAINTINIANRKVFHGILDRSTVAPLPTNLTGSTFTLSASGTPITYYYNGTKVIVDSNKTCTVTSGLSYICFSGITGDIYSNPAFPGFSPTADVYFAFVLYNNSDYGIVFDERHSHDRDLKWHEWAHDTVGVRYQDGLTMTNNGGTAGAARFTYTGGTIHDEDIDYAISSGTTARIFFPTSASTIGFDNLLSVMPFSSGTNGLPQYINTTTWARTTLTSAVNRYINTFLYATNSILNPIWSLIEPVSATVAANNGYNSTTAARGVGWPNLSNYGLGPEYKPLYRMIVRADGVLQAINLAQDDYRSVTSLPMSAGSPPSTANSVSFSAYSDIPGGSVQTAIEDLADLRIISGTSIGGGTSLFNSLSGNYLVFNTLSGINIDITSSAGVVTLSGGSFTGGAITSAITPTNSGTLTLGTAAIPFSGIYSNQYGTTCYSLTGATGTVAIDWNNGTSQKIDYTGVLSGTCTFTFANPLAGSSYVLTTTQNASGTVSVIFPTAKWLGGISGTLTASSGTSPIDMFSFYYDGVNYLAGYTNNFF